MIHKMELDDDCLSIATDGGWLKHASTRNTVSLTDAVACCSMAIYRSFHGRPFEAASDGRMRPEDLLRRAEELLNGTR